MHHNSYTSTRLRSLQKQIKNAKLKCELNSGVSKFQIFLFLFIFHLGRYKAKASMKAKMKIPQEMSIYMRYLHQHGGIKISHIIKQYTQFAERSTYRHCKTEVRPGLMQDRRKYNKGSPTKPNSRDERQMIPEIPRLQEQLGDTFTAKRVKYAPGLTDVPERTVRQCLNKQKYSYCTKRHKGIATMKDCRKS